MDITDIETYIQSIVDAAEDMRASLGDIDQDDPYDKDLALEEVRDWAQQIEGHALDIIDIVNKNRE